MDRFLKNKNIRITFIYKLLFEFKLEQRTKNRLIIIKIKIKKFVHLLWRIFVLNAPFGKGLAINF